MILGRRPMPPATGGVGVGVAVVLVPDGADILWIGFEEESGHRVDTAARMRADGAGSRG
jgi:hypothetical protein